jgi:hypothetical protein
MSPIEGQAKVRHGKIRYLPDMSLPPKERRRKPKGKRKAGKGGGTAQLDHGHGSKADKLRKTGEAKLRRQRRGRR